MDRLASAAGTWTAVSGRRGAAPNRNIGIDRRRRGGHNRGMADIAPEPSDDDTPPAWFSYTFEVGAPPDYKRFHFGVGIGAVVDNDTLSLSTQAEAQIAALMRLSGDRIHVCEITPEADIEATLRRGVEYLTGGQGLLALCSSTDLADAVMGVVQLIKVH